MILGHTTSGDITPAAAPADSLIVSEFTVPKACLISKLTAYLDGAGTTNGDQAFRAVIYDSSGNLVAESPEVVIEDLDDPAWVDFIFDSPVAVTADDYVFGLHTGATNEAAQYYGSGDGTNADLISDAYSDGAPSSISPSWGSGELAIFATYAYAWEPPFETDLYLANLAYPSAQAALNTAEADPRTKRRVYASWHGTFLDPQSQGASLAVTQVGGALSDLVGERVRVSSDSRSTVVYIHRETDLDLDDDTQISLSRRAWQALAPLSDDTLLVTVEVISAAEE